MTSMYFKLKWCWNDVKWHENGIGQNDVKVISKWYQMLSNVILLPFGPMSLWYHFNLVNINVIFIAFESMLLWYYMILFWCQINLSHFEIMSWSTSNDRNKHFLIFLFEARNHVARHLVVLTRWTGASVKVVDYTFVTNQ